MNIKTVIAAALVAASLNNAHAVDSGALEPRTLASSSAEVMVMACVAERTGVPEKLFTLEPRHGLDARVIKSAIHAGYEYSRTHRGYLCGQVYIDVIDSLENELNAEGL